MAPLPDRLPVLVDLELQERDMLPFQVIDGLRRDEERSGHRDFPREERVGVVRVGVEVLPVPDEEVQLVTVAQLLYDFACQTADLNDGAIWDFLRLPFPTLQLFAELYRCLPAAVFMRYWANSERWVNKTAVSVLSCKG